MRGAPDESWLRTPERRGTFVLLGIAALLWLYASTIHSLWTDLRREQLPWCADSIAIPMFELSALALVTVPLLGLAAWTVTLTFGTLPAPLQQWDHSRPIRSWIVTLISGAAVIGVINLLLDSIQTSMAVAAPTFVLSVYLLASTRAAVLSPRKRRDAVAE